ncbi:MAG TPA: winged helix-turn-helix domain-containing protein [Bryobacteraceae bacterium]|nr:winged helix-turn-helix domain-containing protein [Bryobacteraceae bacterium]
MGSVPTEGRAIRFGVYEVDLAAGELRKRGRAVKLQGQPFQILAMLLRRPGEVVSREELQQALWPSGTFVEFEHGVNTAIRKIREALGDSADNPRFIETLPRKGYRFIAPVNGIRPALQAPARRSVVMWALASIAAAAVAGAVWLYLSRFDQPAPSPLVVPLTTYPGSECDPSFSPDGNQVVFAWDGGDKADAAGLYVKVIGTDAPVRLAAGRAFAPAWSPDGRWIVFARALPGSETIVQVLLIPATGGFERKLAEIKAAPSPDFLPQTIDDPATRAEFWPPFSWDSTAKWIAGTAKPSESEPTAVFLLSATTGEKRKLTSPPTGIPGDGLPAFAPDGRALLFVRTRGAHIRDLYLVELSRDFRPNGEPVRLTFENRFVGKPVWMPDGRSILFPAGSVHNPSLWRLALTRLPSRPGKLERLAFAGFGVTSPAVSRQDSLAYSLAPFDTDIWRLELDDTGRAAKLATKLIVSTRIDHTPQYSPDGRRIAFGSDRSGNHEIWVSNSDGSNAMKLTSFDGPYVADPRWSPDGRFIAFGASGEQSTVYAISSDGGTPGRVVAGSLDGWSRDGKWIYFSSDLKGNHELWKVPVNGNPVQVTRRGGTGGVESPDGRFLYYKKTANGVTSLWKAPVEGGEEVRILDSFDDRYFVVAERGIYFLTSEGKRIQFYSFATRKVETVAEFQKFNCAWGLSVSPDGRQLLYSFPEEHDSDLMLVENFR